MLFILSDSFFVCCSAPFILLLLRLYAACEGERALAPTAKCFSVFLRPRGLLVSPRPLSRPLNAAAFAATAAAAATILQLSLLLLRLPRLIPPLRLLLLS